MSAQHRSIPVLSKRRFRQYTGRRARCTSRADNARTRGTKMKHPGGHAARRGVARHRLCRCAYSMFSIST
nr:GNAT family acetyltransferase [Burkholderia pseudomallei]